MATTPKKAKFKKKQVIFARDLERFRQDDAWKGTLQAWMKAHPKTLKTRPRDKIRIRQICRLCGRPRAVFRKFGVCRICFRSMASDGLIPGVRKASW
jgi:small subunit ribosomal protein S14